MQTYWLARQAGGTSEGPYGLPQLRVMYESGAITAAALICPKGEKEWRPVDEIIPVVGGPVAVVPRPVYRPPAPANPMAAFERSRDMDREKGAAQCGTWAGLLIFGMMIAGAMPPVMPLAWLLTPVIMLVCLILGILIMTKGRIFRGIMTLLFSLVLLPIWVASAPFIWVGIKQSAKRAEAVR